MIRTSHGASRYGAANELDYIFGTAKTFAGAQTAGVVFCHGGGDTATNAFTDQYALLAGLGRHATVVAADLGYDTAGNDTAVTRIDQAITYLRTTWGSSGPVALVGMSMGTQNALVYALNHPTEVACIAGLIPLVSVASAITTVGPAMFDAAYPPSWAAFAEKDEHDPLLFAGDLDPDLPVHLWSASDDPYALEAATLAFVAARPQTGFTDVGPLGHTDAAMTAATPAVIDFVHDHL